MHARVSDPKPPRNQNHPSFGTEGKATAAFPSSSEDDLNAMAIQQDGNIVAAGASDIGDRGYDFALARLWGDIALPRGTVL